MLGGNTNTKMTSKINTNGNTGGALGVFYTFNTNTLLTIAGNIARMATTL